MSVIIRRAVAADLDAVTEIERQTSESPWSRESLAKDIEDMAKSIVLVAEFTDEARAETSVVAYADAWCVAGEAQLNNIGVLPEYRGQGIGDALLFGLEAACRDFREGSNPEGCSIMTLEVRRSNETAQGLYTKHGFEIVGERRAYYNNGEDAILMNKGIL